MNLLGAEGKIDKDRRHNIFNFTNSKNIQIGDGTTMIINEGRRDHTSPDSTDYQ